MNVHVYTTRASTPERPQWRARGELGPVRIWTATYATPESAAVKAIGMLRAALAAGESGDFVMQENGGYSRRTHV